MSYQVLARKWRPQTFSELVGQQHVVDAITNALDNNKLHHAYLFTGTRGVGKTTIARIFSKSLNCEEGQSANPCGKCGTCLDISEGRFVDLLEIDAASRTKVEDTRELLDNVQYKPTRGKYKVYLIDEVHMLSKHSFNALLKTLEEPPPHVKFLLATTDPQKLPVTILSRCLQFSLKSLSREQIQTQLAHILDAEALAYEMPALSQIARAAAGSMRDALSLTDQAIAQGNNQVSLDTVISMLGLLDKNQILRLAKCICERDANGAMHQLDEICAESPDYSQVLSQLLGLMHQIALTQIVPDICKLDTNVAKPIYTLSKSVSEEHIQLLYQIGLNGKRDLPFAPDALTGLQMTIMRMIAFTPAQSIPLEVSSFPENNDSSPATKPVVEHDVGAPQVAEVKNHEDKTLAQQEHVENEHIEHGQAEPIRQSNTAQQIAPSDLQTEVPNVELDTSSNEAEQSFDEQQVSQTESQNGIDNKASHSEQHELDDQQNHTNSEAHSVSVEEDSHSNLQDLFDMEDELTSYEQQALEEVNGKKSESEALGVNFSASSLGLKDHEHAEQPAVELDQREPSVNDGPNDLKPSVTVKNTGTLSDDLHKDVFQNAEELDNSSLSEPPWSTEDNSHVVTSDISETKMQRDNESGLSSTEVASTEVPAHENHEAHNVVDTEVHNDKATIADESSLKPYLDNGKKLTLASQIDKWSLFVDSLDVRGLARQLLIHGRSSGIKDQCLKLEINESHHHLNEASSINTIQQALADKFQRDIELTVEYNDVSNSPYELQQKIDAMRLQYAKSTIDTDTAFQELIKAFDATVVSDSIEAR